MAKENWEKSIMAIAAVVFFMFDDELEGLYDMEEFILYEDFDFNDEEDENNFGKQLDKSQASFVYIKSTY